MTRPQHTREAESAEGDRVEAGPPDAAARWALALPFLVLAVAVTWPLAAGLGDGLPLGTETIATVPLFNLWTLAWNVESIGRGGYWDAPIFHPAQGTFAFSEPQPLPGLVALVASWFGASPITTYNLILLLALFTNGWLSALLLRALGLGWTAAFGGGVLVLFVPFVHQELGVLQLVPLGGILAGSAGVWSFARRSSLQSGALLGVAWAGALAIASQTAVFAALALVPTAVFLCWRQLRSKRFWIGLGIAGLLALVLVSPILLAQSRAFSEESFERSARTQANLSAKASHYLLSAWSPLLPTPGIETAEHPGRRAFWPGALRLVLALAACWMAWREPKWRTPVVAAALVLGWAFLLSQAGRLDAAPMALLRSLPGLAQVRSWYRFALIVQLALCFLAAIGLDVLARCVVEKVPRQLAIGLVLMIAGLAALEVRPGEFEIQALPSPDLSLPWLDWVRDNTSPDDVLAFVPFPEGRSSAHYLGTTQWMFWQLQHWRPMANGYSGFFPEDFRRLKETMQEFPSEASFEALAERDVRWCIVHRAYADLPETLVAPSGRHAVRRVFRDAEHALDVYELLDAP